MKIDNDHMYNGAALLQIAEHRNFTAINRLGIRQVSMRNAYRINDNIIVYLKYSSKSKGPYSEHHFNFSSDELGKLIEISQKSVNLYLGLVCIEAKEICCLSYSQLNDLISRRQNAFGNDEDQYLICVTADKGKSFRAYVNEPRRKGTMIGKPMVIKRSGFPNILFE